MSRQAARLEVVAGKGVGTSILVEDELLLGREFEEAGALADDDEISRRHARLAFDDAGRVFRIEDLGSTNGTFVNGSRVMAPQPLSVGDTIELGGTTLIVRVIPGPGDDTTVRVDDRAATVSEASSPSPTPAPVTAEGRHSSVQPTTASLTVSASREMPSPEELVEFDGDASAPEAAAPSEDHEAVEFAGDASAPEAAVPSDDDEPPRASLALSLRLEVDFAARHARIAVDKGDGTMWLVFEEGAWRSPPGSSETP